MGGLEPFRASWNKTWAAHLLNRAGFGPLPDEIGRAAAAGLEATVDALLDFERVEEAFLPPETPELPESPRRQMAGLSPEERNARIRQFNRDNRDAIEETRGWWIRRMLRSRAPLREKMTLFWHSHFATSANDVKFARLMLNQNEFLRENCLGNFRDLLLGISRDPAMLKFLDNNTNRKRSPNENYAREFLELFSMGIGNYTEDDVRAAARAFTGWTFRGEQFFFNERDHDTGAKTFLGRTGNLGGADIVDIVLEQPCTARFMATKLLRYFACDDPEAGIVEEVATLLRASRYEFRPVVRALLGSQYFYSPKTYRTQIKSPVQLVIGSTRLVRAEVNERRLAVAMRSLGQDLLYPPNVKGWDGGETWINTTTLLRRYNFAGELLRDGDRPRKWKHELNVLYGPDIAADAPRLVDSLVARLLQAHLELKARQWLIEQAETTRVSERPLLVAHLIMSMPDYQLC